MKPLVVKPGRVACCVPFCRRTFKDEGYLEVMCGAHARLADRKYRRLLARTHRRLKRGSIGQEIGHNLCAQLWAIIKEQAISRC